MARTSFPQLRNKRICLLIAHPDDEAMFFAPTLLALTDEDAGNHVKILCLSNGNAANLGPTRTRELTTSALTLGIRSASDILVLDDPNFPDSMTTTWSAPAIARVLSSAFSPAHAPDASSAAHQPSSSSSPPPTATIDILLTFDPLGISHHPNHRSLPLGAHLWLQTLMRSHGGWACPVGLYTLTSTSTFRKYLSVFDAPITMAVAVLGAARGPKKKADKALPDRLLYVSDFAQWRRAQRAMAGGHRSQMVWFRWGWVALGRYMVVNDLRRDRV
ncbi:Putative deacetylase LmbE-like domain [Lasallia pustulata]|uniref:N-acetylglucosaminylphosphatidylinositol deacetylase n=1 Tax=Lasallia pustulata TaxID=136370 RepID=A0A1W5D072_9LECA|nr:Putative deacetylase LmbE-like domain [Lasallia pustulata]